MYLASTILTCALFAQIATLPQSDTAVAPAGETILPGAPSGVAGQDRPRNDRLAPLDQGASPAQLPPLSEPPAAARSATSVQSVLGPPEMIARWMQLPGGTEVTGRELSLYEALSLVGDPRRQLEVVHAYWRLAGAVAEYRVGHDQVDALAALRVRPEDEAMLRTARAAASASRDEAEVALIEAQHELAEQAMLPTTLPLPLPADRPHVGPYRTYFAEIFAGRPAPVLGQRIDRTLPIRRRAIDSRAEAVRAAEAACSSAEEAYRAGRADLEAILSSMTQLTQQRRWLIGSVCEYNDEIADYVIFVVARPADVAALVTMMIKPSRPIAVSTMPIAMPGQGGAVRNRPTLAPPRDAVRQAGNDESAAAPSQSPVLPLVDQSPTTTPPGKVSPRLPAARPSTAPTRIAPREPLRLDGASEPPNSAPIQGLGDPGATRQPGMTPVPPSKTPESEAPKLLVVPAEPAT